NLQTLIMNEGPTGGRSPHDPDTPEFMDAYWQARRGKGKRKNELDRTWEALIVEYYRSPEFKQTRDGTRKNYKRQCEDIRKKNGKLDIRSFKRSDAIRVRNALQDTWSKANERIAVLSILLNFAVDLDWIATNPVVNIPKLKGGEYRHWPDSKLTEFEVFCDQNDRQLARTAYELAIGTGQRLGDCIKMRWSDLDDDYEFMSVVQEKTGRKIEVYCPQRLRTYLRSLRKSGQHIMAKSPAQPIGIRQVQKAIEDVRKAIGVFQGEHRLVPHGWRYTAVKELADAGVDISDIKAVTGHQTLEMAQKYASGADQKKASKRAQQKRERSKDKSGKCETICETTPGSQRLEKENINNAQ
ncbi:tyrosine-type recombinase/integrase, partial [Pseudooceanicola atlanticus]|uniref:tyrosine-type recombinase/integrase n=2 Tax=Pseudooceanicola atlanticus TaxID=1461694 RepID=UPI0012E0B9C5